MSNHLLKDLVLSTAEHRPSTHELWGIFNTRIIVFLDGHGDWLHILAVVNSATINLGIQESPWYVLVNDWSETSLDGWVSNPLFSEGLCVHVRMYLCTCVCVCVCVCALYRTFDAQAFDNLTLSSSCSQRASRSTREDWASWFLHKHESF
jgi:hypothetical protein